MTYDGHRRDRHYVVIKPGTTWGETAYGLKPTDDFTFSPRAPDKGDAVDLVVSDETYRLLVLQRERRKQFGGSRPRKIRPPWQR